MSSDADTVAAAGTAAAGDGDGISKHETRDQTTPSPHDRYSPSVASKTKERKEPQTVSWGGKHEAGWESGSDVLELVLIASVSELEISCGQRQRDHRLDRARPPEVLN